MQERLNLLKMVENDLKNGDPVSQAYAIRVCCMKNISSPSIIDSLKNLKQSRTRVMWQNISDAATAALDLLGIEHYTGDNPVIIEMIRTKDYSDKE